MAWVLLAHIVEQVSGERYASFLAEHIFRPLDMNSTGAGNSAPKPEQQTIGYSGETRAPSFELDHVGVGAGDIWSTSEDMALWNAALVTPGLLDEGSLQHMFTAHAPVPGSGEDMTGVHYGYGWFIARLHGHRIVYHPGDNAGFPADDAIHVSAV